LDLLNDGAYLMLEREPDLGHYLARHNLYITRQKIIPQVLMVQIYYQIEHMPKVVHLISIQRVQMEMI
jgi:hypothetical protein